MQTLRLIFAEPFRIFFLSAGLFAVFAILVWEIWLGVHFAGGMVNDLPFAAAPHLWHGHEMIFGYAGAALGGFFLTAVPNWTGARSAAQWFVTTAALVWLAGRIAIWFSGTLDPVLVAVIDLAFLPFLGVKIALMLIKRPKPQNVAFLAFLSVIWVGNLMVHLEWIGVTDDTLATGLRVGLLGLCLMIAVLGGRVTPAFTRNAMKRQDVPEDHLPNGSKLFDRGAIIFTALSMLATLFSAPQAVIGFLFLIAGIAQFGRIFFWSPAWTLAQPILWALHLAMGMLGLGLVLAGAAEFGIGSEVGALHVLGIGAVGGMTLAMMSRAVLGHTGRALHAPVPVAVAYGVIALAAVLRWAASVWAGDFYFPAMLITGALWIAGFLLYAVTLWPAFTQPRPGRK